MLPKLIRTVPDTSGEGVSEAFGTVGTCNLSAEHSRSYGVRVPVHNRDHNILRRMQRLPAHLQQQ